MTTLVREAGAGGRPPATSPPPARRRGDWAGGWRVALRMARRDLRRHKGRSILVALMVGVPNLLLVFGLTIGATTVIGETERTPFVMGTGQALVLPPERTQVVQSPTGAALPPEGGRAAATPIPGYAASTSPEDNAGAIGSLLGGTANPVATVRGRAQLGDRAPTVTALAVGSRIGLDGKAELVAGRWPEAADETLVSPRGAARGLPTTGTVALTFGKESHTYRVVGTATAATAELEVADLVITGTQVPGSIGSGWIIVRDAPITWPEVRRLNRYGLLVTSADVLRHPPALADVPPELRDLGADEDAQILRVGVLGGVVLLIVTALLAGPALAVSAARQRRTLALAASNGAATSQLRQTVLAQAIVLGALSALAGAGLGIGAAYLVHRLQAGGTGDIVTGAFDVPLVAVLAVVACSIASTIAAALVPARRLGRLDIVGVMHGQSVSPPPSRWLFLIGAAAAVASGLGLVSLVVSGQPETSIALAAVGLVLGALLTVPVILHVIGRLGSRLPVPLRMASRDLARHRARSSPTVAAVLAGVAALTMGLVGMTSDQEQQRREYSPRTIAGEGIVQGDAGIIATLATTLPRAHPTLRFTPLSSVRENAEASSPTAPLDQASVAAVPPGCTPQQTVIDEAPSGDPGGASRCQVLGTTAPGEHVAIAALPSDEIIRRLGLSGGQAATVRGGGGVVMTSHPVTSGGRITVARLSTRVDPTSTSPPTAADITLLGTVTVPVVEVPLTLDNAARMAGTGLLVPPSVAGRGGLPLAEDTLLVHTSDGTPLTEDEADRIRSSVGTDAEVSVERGFVSETGLVLAILLAVFVLLLLVVTLTTTALTLAEQQDDQATLAALGATRGTRRTMAAAQALVLSVVGCVLGVAVGLAPGIAIAHPLTAQQLDPLTGSEASPTSIVVIPWAALALICVVAPLVAAALAAVGIRRAPTATQRVR